MRILDTDTCIAILRGQEHVIDRRAATLDTVATTWITVELTVRASTANEFEEALGPLFGAPGPRMAGKPLLLNGSVAITRRVENADGSLTGTIYLGRPGAPFGPE